MAEKKMTHKPKARAQAGADIKTLQNDLGHESIQTTLDKYGHVNEEMKKDAANKRSALLKSLTAQSR